MWQFFRRSRIRWMSTLEQKSRILSFANGLISERVWISAAGEARPRCERSWCEPADVCATCGHWAECVVGLRRAVCRSRV